MSLCDKADDIDRIEIAARNHFIWMVTTKYKQRCPDRCPLCRHKATAYYCKDCVTNGNFYHSCVEHPERYADKKLRWLEALQIARSYELNEHTRIQETLQKYILEAKISMLKTRVESLRNTIDEAKTNALKTQLEVKEAQNVVSRLSSSVPIFNTIVDKYRGNMDGYRTKCRMRANLLMELEIQFKHKVKDEVDGIFKCFFPITKVDSKTWDIDRSLDTKDETVIALAEATQMNYVRGRWVKNTFPHDHLYKIIASVLPASGDYAAFAESEFEGYEGFRKDAKNLVAGLSYLTQLVNITAHVARVILPLKLSFRDFNDIGQEELRTMKFHTKVCKLNANIVHLCVSQGVSPNLLPSRAIPNLLTLLEENQGDLGSQGSFEYCQSLVDALEDDRCSSCSDFCYASGSDSDYEILTGDYETITK